MTIDWQWDFDCVAAIVNAWPDAQLEAKGFPIWALWTVESIDYLAALDKSITGPPLQRPYGHGPEVVEIAHARWATGSAVTALNLCAATLASRHTNQSSAARAAALSDFALERKTKRAQALHVSVPAAALTWTAAVLQDPEFQLVRDARNPFTHNQLHRTVYGTRPDAPRMPTEFRVGPNDTRFSGPELVAKALDVATKHVGSFFDGLAADDF